MMCVRQKIIDPTHDEGEMQLVNAEIILEYYLGLRDMGQDERIKLLIFTALLMEVAIYSRILS